MDIGYKVKAKNPKESVNFISKLIFWWMVNTVRKGATKGLEISDLFKPLDKDNSRKVTDRLELKWQNEVRKAREENSTPSFLKALTKTFFLEFMFYGVLWFILFVGIKCALPVVLARLISLYADAYTEEKKNDYYATSAVLLGLIILSIFFYNHLLFGLSAIGMRMRIGSSSLVYRKITKLSHKALGQTAAGQIVNLLSNDVSRFDQSMHYLHSLWVMPIQAMLMSYIIWQQVGISALAGIFSMLIVSLPVQIYIGKLMGKLRLSISTRTDKRVKLMGEIISGIQVIKMYAWEKSFEKIVKIARIDEVKRISIASQLRGVFATCIVILERSSLFFTIICFALQGNVISADIVFSLAQAFNILQLGMAGFFSWAIGIGAENLVSIQRLQDFLVLEERQESTIEEMNQSGIVMLNVNASWRGYGSRTLGDIMLKITPGTLCAVVGPVGAGKSSLLQLLLGELPATSGRIQMGKSVSYCSQGPWLFQSTVRNNILFGQSYNKDLYDKVVRVCALERDFEQFPNGDKTVVSERGVTLSGGQRARINLARAIYRQADIYLLDDPLSAVDAHVGKHLFEECISKHLKGTTRILVTHQLQYLKEAHLIVVLNEGQIEAQGTFEELSNSKLDFTKMLSQVVQPADKKEGEPELVATVHSITSKHGLTLSLISSDISQSVDVFPQHNQEEIEEESGSDPNNKPFKDYVFASKNICLLVILIVMLIIAQALCASADFWVAFWTEQEKIRHTNNTIILESPLVEDVEIHTLNNSSTQTLQSYIYNASPTNLTIPHSFSFDDIFDHIRIDNDVYKVIKTNYAMYFYGILIAGATIFTLVRSILYFQMCMMSSVNLHTNIFHSLLQAPMKFFNNTPSGRILNRVSKDIGAIDEVLPRELLDALQIFLVMAGIMVNVAVSNHYSMIAMVILGIIFFKMRTSYISTAKSLKHLEAKTKSPVYSHINSTINGIYTIRASKVEDILMDEFDQHQDVHTAAWYLLLGCMSAFALWIDIICVIFIACIIFSFVVLHSYSSVSGSLVGLAIAQSMILTSMVQYGLRQAAEVINQLTSVERVMEYTKIDTEGPFDTPEEYIPKGPWPRNGMIEFQNVSLKYVESEPPVLKNLNFSLRPGEKIGIVGRTGAGKSSLVAALFRLTSFDGAIYIDGEDTKNIGLSELRKHISIIPQEPVLFSASLRYNLDPFDEFDDDQIWNALEQVELKDNIESLDYIVAEGGTNFSIGQRQLICLARAALRNNKILVLDEATANVDPRTDLFIQAKIREKFTDCTVLTVAHRLNTIMDSDRVLVMSFGNMVEFDHPHKLLQMPEGHLSKLIMETGTSMAMQLRDIAMGAYSNKTELRELVS